MKLKRYYFNAYNADEIIINRISVVCNDLETARRKAVHKLNLLYGGLACFCRLNFDYHETI